MNTNRLKHFAILKLLLIFGFVAHGSALQAQTRPSGGMLRYPDVSQDRIVFVYADDLWTVPREGGQASPLASPSGAERYPRFSPDGQSIAFVGNYDGGTDIYVVGTDGGSAQRLTFHPASETICDWMPDGKHVLYSTNGFAGLSRQPQLYKISFEQPNGQPLPVPYGTNGAVSADGKWLAYTPHSRDGRTWKRYRGGMASDVWLYNLETNASKQITDFEGTDSLPMWQGQVVYYLSDAGDEHRLNLWSYDTQSGERKQVTEFRDFDCKWPAIGPGPDGKGEIVVQNGSSLYLVSLPSGDAKAVEVIIPGDRPTIRPQVIDASEFVNGADISPSGKRVAVEARGDIWTAPAKNGSPRNLTATSGVAERDPSWSPDGRWIAYFSDQTGEYELFVTQSDGRGETRQLTKDGSAFRFSPIWSPNSKLLSFRDKTGDLFLHDLDRGETKKVDNDPYAQPLIPSWSHDSAWLTYAKAANDRSGNSSVWIYKVSDGSLHQVTSGFFNDSTPVFDRKGEHIFLRSNRAFNAPQYEDVGSSFIYSGTEVLIAIPLRSDIDRPFAPKSDEETWEEEKEAEDKDGDDDDTADEKDANKEEPEADEAAADEASDTKPSDTKPTDGEQSDNGESDGENGESDDEAKEIEIEFEGIESRAFQLPVGQGNFGSMAVNDKGQLLYARRSARGSQSPPKIQLLDLGADAPKEATVVEGAGGFAMSADGKKLLVGRGDSVYIIDAAPGQKLDQAVSTSGMDVQVDPRAEWRQMFVDAWRMERDFFYDPTMHGVNWKAIREHYEPMLDDCVSRRDLSFVISEMIAELNVGHAYYREGDVESGPSGNCGLLGCRFQANGKAYQMVDFVQGADWDLDARNPLRAAGISEGSYLLAVNGRRLTTDMNPYSVFAGTAGRTITLTVSEDDVADADDKQVVVKALGSDRNLRFRHWIEMNRQQVAAKTDGKVGYIYVINTGIPGQNDLFRQFYGQLGKEALIIDDRWNGGGQIPTRFIELLNRPVTNYWARRDGADWTWPTDSHQGPKCMLINGMAGSGGDMFPALFKQAGLGKLIGMRTWGGLVGITGGPGLIDGASVTAPSFAYYEKDGTWGIEGHGVDADIRVVDDPAEMTEGRDPQLTAAIEHMLEQLRTNPYRAPKRPAYPDRSKFGIAPEDK